MRHDRRVPTERFEEGDLLTIAQARSILPLSRSAIYKLCDAGKLLHIRVSTVGGGGRVLILRAGLDAFILERIRERPIGTMRPHPAESPDDILARIEGTR